MFRKLLSHAAIYGLAAQVPRLAGILALPVITPYLTTVDYGVGGVITAYVVALNTLISLGLSVVMVNSFAKHPHHYKWVWRQLHGFLSVWAVANGVLLTAVLWWAIPEEAMVNRWELLALNVLPVVLFGVTEYQGTLLFLISQRPVPVAIRSFVVGVATVGLNIYTIAYLRMGYMGWFYANAAGALIGFVYYSYPMYLKEKMWPIFNFKWPRIRQSLKISLPIIPHHFSFFLLDTSDRLVLDLLKVPVPRIGLYNIASSFGLYFMAASNAVVQAASPFYLQYYSKSGKDIEAARQARSMTFALQLLFLGVTFILCLWLKELFILLIRNSELQQAYPLAIILMMGYNYKPMYLGAVNLLSYREHTGVLWKISTVAGVGNVILNLILIPYFGIEAAAITTFVALMYMGYSGYALKEYKQIAEVNYHPWLWLLVNIMALLAVYLLKDVDLEYKAILTAFLGAGASIGYLYFGKRLAWSS
ncbi:lipopolysaccharide biosynthesis protein [Pontibacter cellulosilyticus]|uniref:Lipopolysaccharide biosynthesis protein n=1 Tax=Pontibacter cellulosilyticus TaxID=1720253 RepID=A0A923SIX2_9BACT|nr:lipopolysaccharide biosynthesis protein [Pontibacter cellulosilyticus]MBC5993052.1 lipopolysaccharide biosynthesis protein [Pontibacter cellulosilyticus]